MKSIAYFFIWAITVLSIHSCGDGNNAKTKNNKDINIDDVVNSQSKDPNAKGDNKCLLAFAEKYDRLLTEEMVLKATGFSKDKLTAKYQKVMKNTADHSMIYNFNNGRKQLRLGLKSPMVLPDDVVIKGIKPISLKMFEDSYRAMTAEEQQHYEDAKKDVISGNNQEANDAIKNSGVDKKTLEKGVNKLDGVFSKVANAYVVLDNLGDAARWNTATNEMIVLQNGVQFVLVVNVAEDNNKNRTVAADLARQILSKCK